MRTIERLLNAFLDFFNRINKKMSADNAAHTIANGDRVLKSDKSFSDLANKSDSDRAD